MYEPMTGAEIKGDYERETGHVIVECFEALEPSRLPGVLVHQHAPFVWGTEPSEAVHNAVVLEEVAKIASRTVALKPDSTTINQHLLDKHFFKEARA